MIDVLCGGCNTTRSYADHEEGQERLCTRCGAKLLVPPKPTPAPSAATDLAATGHPAAEPFVLPNIDVKVLTEIVGLIGAVIVVVALWNAYQQQRHVDQKIQQLDREADKLLREAQDLLRR